jgi:hypothetical protein
VQLFSITNVLADDPETLGLQHDRIEDLF